jgi:hypothetical protein
MAIALLPMPIVRILDSPHTIVRRRVDHPSYLAVLVEGVHIILMKLELVLIVEYLVR